MDQIQKYFRDVSVRKNFTQEKISEMCDVHRTTVTKWMKPGEHSITKAALQRYREALVKEHMYEELAIFDQVLYETYAVGFTHDDMFNAEYVPLPFKDCFSVNESVMPKCLYKPADIYDLTEQFPDRLYFEIIAATERYGSLVGATDKIFPGKSQLELLRCEKLYELRKQKLKQYGITENFFTKNILNLPCIPRHIGEIPDELRTEIYKNRFKQTYFRHSDTDIDSIINAMMKCSGEGIVVEVSSKNLTQYEIEMMAIEQFFSMYLSDYKNIDMSIRFLFTAKKLNNKTFMIGLTDTGTEIVHIFDPRNSEDLH